jgi:hypothetical protein
VRITLMQEYRLTALGRYFQLCFKGLPLVAGGCVIPAIVQTTFANRHGPWIRKHGLQTTDGLGREFGCVMRVDTGGRPNGARPLCGQPQCRFTAGNRGTGRDEARDTIAGSAHENFVQVMDEALVREVGPDIDQHQLPAVPLAS